MARIASALPVLPSLLDRLIDEDPHQLYEKQKSYGVVLSEIKDNIRRDLECLLNTRLYRENRPPILDELDKSIVNYGLPDFGMVQLGSEEGKQKFKAQIQKAIEIFEPRFRRVSVELQQIGEDFERALYLKISAVLMIEPDPISLLFDSRVKVLDKSLNLRVLSHG
jgi:type VI secretion system protein ImpF